MDEIAHRLSADWHNNPEQGYCLLEYHWLRRYATLHTCTLTEAAHLLPKRDSVDVEEIVPRHVIAELNDVSPVLTVAAVKLNDALLADGPYQRLDLEPGLRALEPLLADTEGQPEADRVRALLALDWLVRDYLVTWFRLTPALAVHADSLAALPPLAGQAVDYAEADSLVRAIRAAAHAAADGIVASSWDAASDAAQAAGVYTAWDAAEIGDAAITATVAADFVAEAAETAIRVAIQHTEPEAATALLRPTVSALQESALALFERMLAVSGE